MHGMDAIPQERTLALCELLFPIARSITGNGVRQTLRLLQDRIPLLLHEVPSGTRVFDWTVPLEWNVEAAYVCDENGNRLVDLDEHSLHLVSYSEPFRGRLTLEELQPHLHSLPAHPDWIPYRTSYYDKSWGFCLRHSDRQGLTPGLYDIAIDSTLAEGSLTYGELVVPGETQAEVLVSTHVCHPSLANDNLSGIAVATFLAKHLMDADHARRYTYRFLFIPGTIGAITWLALNEQHLHRVVGGVVLSGVGDAGSLTYKRSRSGGTTIDRVFERVLHRRGESNRILPFIPYGYDERQYCSPGINLPVGCLMRTPFGEYPEYHTSGDNLDFIVADAMEETLSVCLEAFDELECTRTYRNLSPKCEPQLGRRGLYEAIGGDNDRRVAQMALLWMLSYSDGSNSTLDIGDLSGLDLESLYRAAVRLKEANLLVEEV